MFLKFNLLILAFITTSNSETVENATITETNTLFEGNSSIPTVLEATASKLVRFRSKPPMSYYRHKSQNFKRPRPRIKHQKLKPGRPSYSIPESSSYFRKHPETYTRTKSYKISPTYEEIHYEVSSDFPLIEGIPLSSYESQAMELDFYGETYPKQISPSYEYPKPQKKLNVQRPHKVYGVPKEPSYNSYDTYSESNYDSKPKVQYEIEQPHEEYVQKPKTKEKYEKFPPYGEPPKVTHQPEYVSYQISSQPKYEKETPNAGYTYSNNFAEPPTDIHITYSPSYEINPLPPMHPPQKTTYSAPPGDSYGPPNDSYGPSNDNYGPTNDNYEHPNDNYEPPNKNYASPNDNYGPPRDSYEPPDYNQNSHPTDSYHQPNSGPGNFAEPPGSYLPPMHHPEELPLNNHHMPPGYDYSKTSYQVPIYDPIPFESTTPDQDYFPPYHHSRITEEEHVSQSSNNIEHVPQSSSSSSETTTLAAQVENEPVQQANKKVNRFIPSKRRFKNRNRNESASKTTAEIIDEVPLSEAPSTKYIDEILSTTSTFRPRRKRKRTKTPPTEKHNLDSPELQKAFEVGHDLMEEPTAHASNIKENIEPVKHHQNTSEVKKITDFSPSHSWNPMKRHTKERNPQRGQRTAENTFEELKNAEIISIEKSHSHSYYAGTVSPSLPTRIRTATSRADNVKTSTVSSTTLKAKNSFRPTKGLAIDTTYFKVKDDDDEDIYDGTGELPRNHKLY